MKAIIVIFIYAVVSNYLMLSIANSGLGVDCRNLDTSLNTTYNVTDLTANTTDTKSSATDLINVALGRCSGFPAWMYWVFQVPTILGLLYVIRGFIGLT
jgi:hypothetical protein